MNCRATGFFIKYSKQNFNFSNRGSPVEISSSTCMLRLYISGSSLSPANIYCFIIYIKFILSDLQEKYHPLETKALTEKPFTRGAVSIDRLNYTESVELQPFTPGLNLSKPQQETKCRQSGLCLLLSSPVGQEQLLHSISKKRGLSSSGKTNQLTCATEHVAMSTPYSSYS